MKNHNDFNVSQGDARAPRISVLAGMAAFVLTACGGPDVTKGAPNAPSAASGTDPRPAHHGGADLRHHAHGKGHHHRFDDAEGWSKVFDDPARDEWQKPGQVVAAMAITPGMTVADIGAGTGYFLPYLARAVGPTGKVLGQDVEPSMVKWIDERAKRENLSNVQGLLGAADDPKLPPRSVDRVLVVDVWHHIDDRPSFAKKLVAALRPGGAIFIVDYTRESPHGPPQHARISPDEIRQDLAAAGLTTDVLSDVGLPHQYVVRGKL